MKKILIISIGLVIVIACFFGYNIYNEYHKGPCNGGKGCMDPSSFCSLNEDCVGIWSPSHYLGHGSGCANRNYTAQIITANPDYKINESTECVCEKSNVSNKGICQKVRELVECEEGETITQECADGSVIIIKKCLREGKFWDTGEKCPEEF